MLPYDDKGKIFTDVVSKEAVAVIVQTALHRIEGIVYARPDVRLKDELNQDEHFLAVTDAVLYDLAGNEVKRTGFLAVNRDAIHWVLPLDDSK